MSKDFQPKQFLGYLMAMAIKGVSGRLLENFKEAGFNITRAHWLIMAKTYHFSSDNFLQSEAVEMMMGDKTSVTRVVDDLVKRGWLTREIDEQDRRNRVLKLTELGEEKVPLMMKSVHKTMNEMTDGIETENLQIAKKVLNQIIENAQKTNKNN